MTMGVRIRKSFNLGNGFRVTLSKSGIGYSWGVPGHRITKTAKGSIKKSYSIPGTGIGYVTESSSSSERKYFSKKKKTVVIPQKTVTGKTYDANEYGQMHTIESSDINNFKPVEYKKFLCHLNFLFFCHRLTNIMIVFIIIYLLYAKDCLIISCIGFGIKILLLLFGRIKIEYELDSELNSTFKEYVTAWKHLTKAHYIYQIVQMASIKNLKNNAGAKNAIEKKDMKIKIGIPWYIKSNLKFPILKFRKETLILLPDKVLLVHKWHAGAVNQKKVNFSFNDAKIIEERIHKSSDSELIQYQWLYVNKDGTRDKRFVSNKQFPVYKYGKIDISSPEGINESFIVSNNKLSSKLSDSYKKYKNDFSML